MTLVALCAEMMARDRFDRDVFRSHQFVMTRGNRRLDRSLANNKDNGNRYDRCNHCNHCNHCNYCDHYNHRSTNHSNNSRNSNINRRSRSNYRNELHNRLSRPT